MTIKINSWKKLGVVGSLYVSQYIPVMFLVQALPVFLRQQGVALNAIALLSLLGLPLILKFLWSPLIDRYGFTQWGHYRFWIIGLQSLVAVLTALCAGIDIEQNFPVLLGVAFLICLFCASQDIATDALAVGLLTSSERGLGNGVQLGGHYLGAIIGGGGMLIALSHLGWSTSLLLLALIMLVALIPILFHREHVIPVRSQPANQAPLRSYFRRLLNFCRHPGTRARLLILATYMAGGNMANTMFRPLLVDVGLSLEAIGWLEGVVGHAAGIVGAIAAGVLITPLGRKRSLIGFGLLL